MGSLFTLFCWIKLFGSQACSSATRFYNIYQYRKLKHWSALCTVEEFCQPCTWILIKGFLLPLFLSYFLSSCRSAVLLLAPLLAEADSAPLASSRPPGFTGVEGLLSRFHWMANHVPAFRVPGGHIHILHSPDEFYQAMKVCMCVFTRWKSSNWTFKGHIVSKYAYKAIKKKSLVQHWTDFMTVFSLKSCFTAEMNSVLHHWIIFLL